LCLTRWDAEHEIVEQALDEPPEYQPADLLGLYDGVAPTHRDSWGAPDDR
jgi:predicted Zn-dependent protease with MMP-like domain